MRGLLIFGSRSWLILAAVLLVVGLALVVWRYANLRTNGIARLMAPLFKMLGLLLLAICMLEPLWSGQRARPGANLFVVLADDSQSFRLVDKAPLAFDW